MEEKRVNFSGLSDVSSPVELARFYSDSGADELVFYDINRFVRRKSFIYGYFKTDCRRGVYPSTVGGGINTAEDFDRVLNAELDKVSVTSGAIKNPYLIKRSSGEKVRKPMR